MNIFGLRIERADQLDAERRRKLRAERRQATQRAIHQLRIEWWNRRRRWRQSITRYAAGTRPAILDAIGLALFAVAAFRVPLVGSWLGFLVAGGACLVLNWRVSNRS